MLICITFVEGNTVHIIIYIICLPVGNRKFNKSNALLNLAECNLARTFDWSPLNCDRPVEHTLHYWCYVFAKSFEYE